MANEIKAQSVKKNLIFQIAYQFVILVVPLIIAPYLTRVLGGTALGVYSYTYSVANYFVLFAMLGIIRHGQRIVAARRDDKLALRKAFWSLYTVHAAFSSVAIIAFVTFAAVFGGEYKNIYFIQTLFVASALFDVTWLFYGLENFKSVVIRNFILKIAECVLIFCLVKTSDDLWIYALIMTSSLCLGQLVMVPQAIGYIRPVKFGWADVKEHFKPLFVLFIAVVAATLYTVFDKTLLGIMSTKENVAYYEYSDKIIGVPKTIISVICTVMFPRACASIAKGDIGRAQKYVDYSLQFTCLLGIGSIFGLLGVANLFAVLYYGEGFAICGYVIMALSPNIIIIEIGNIVRTLYIVPNKMDKHLSISYIINAVLNIALSVALIPVLGIYGAVVGTLAAEICGLVYQMILCRKFLPVKKVLITVIPYVLFGAAMFGVIFLIRQYFNATWWHLIFQIAAGGTLYVILSAIYLFKFSSVKENLTGLVHRTFRKKSKVAAGTEQNTTEEEVASSDDKEHNQDEKSNNVRNV